MKSPQEVQAEYEEFRRLSPATKLDLKGFAQTMDQQDGRPDRESVYNDTWYKKLNRAIDVPFNYTPLPGVIASPAEAVGTVGRGLGSLVDTATGTNVAPVLEQIGRETPRMVVEGLATIPLAGSVAGAPAAGAMWANRARRLGQIAGYASAATRGYAETDSPLGAVLGAGQMYGANKLLLPKTLGGSDVGGRAENAVTRWLDKSKDLVPGDLPVKTSTAQRIAGPLARAATDVGAVTALNEATRQGMMSVGPRAVGLTDSARNPLTEENIAANVGGAAFFLPQIISGFAHPAATSPKQREQLHNFLTARDEFKQVATGVAKQSDLPLTKSQGGETTPTPPVDDPARSTALYSIIRQELDAAGKYDLDGNTVEATRARENALLAIDEMSKRGVENVPPEMLAKVKEAIDAEARQQPPATPEGFERFVGEVRSIIDTMNEGRVSYEQELASREAGLNRNDKRAVAEFEAWKKSQAENVGKSWHPNARDPLVVDRLWSNGNLKPLTPEWLESEWNASFDSSGNPQFAMRVVAQKVANYAVERLPSALEAEASTRKAVTTQSERVQKLTELDHDFARALGKIPEDIRNQVFDRTISIQRHGNYDPALAEKMGVTEGVRIDKRSGRQVTPYPEWQKAVIRAVESFDPESGTILMKYPGKGYIRVPFKRLIERTEKGYVWEPFETPLQKGAGGKSVIKGTPEGNIEALETKTAQDLAGAVSDEEAFKQTLAEEGGIGLGERETTDAERLGTLGGEEKVSPAEEVVDDAALAAESNLSERMTARAKEVRTSLAALSDEQLWSLAKDEFNFRTSVQVETKKADLRLAIEAALENFATSSEKGLTPKGKEFLQRMRDRGNLSTKGKGDVEDVKMFLRNFFQFKNPVQGSTMKLPPNVERMARILRKVLDPEAMRRTREPLKPSRPKEGEPTSEGTFVNPPEAGNFLPDVERTLRATFDKYLSRDGYSGTSKEFLTEVGVAIAQQYDMSGFDFYRTTPSYGVAGVGGNRPPRIGLNIDRVPSEGFAGKRVVGLLQTLAHEINHMDGYILQRVIPKPDAYSDERGRVLENMNSLAQVLSPDERLAMLRELKNALPEHLRENITENRGDNNLYGTSDPDEFIAEVTADVVRLLLLDTPQGRAFAKETVDHLPQEAREFAQSTIRTVRDVLDSMQGSAEFWKSQNYDSFVLTKGFSALVDSAVTMTNLRHADEALATARSFIASLTPGNGVRPPPVATNAIWFRGAKDVNDVQRGKNKLDTPMSDTAAEALTEVAKTFSPRAFDKSHTPSKFAQWLYPFANLMVNQERQGVPLARDVANSVFSLEPGISRLYSSMMKGFLKQKPDGSYDFNADHPLVRAVSEDPNGVWRKNGVDAVSRWQQENGTVSLFVKNQDGTIIVNPEAKDGKKAWDTIRKNLSLEHQSLVPAISVALDEANQIAAQHIIKNIQQSNVGIVASYLMAEDKRLTHDQAIAQASAYHDAFLTDNVLSLRGTAPARLKALQKLLIGVKSEANPAGDGLLPKYLEVSKLLESRPGFRSESLPGDWIIKYSTPEGATKYASAPHERQARYLAGQLVREGNSIIGEVVHKNELRQFNEFDNPDTILMKAAETEKFVYERFVKDMEAEHGTALADALREGYTPVGQTLKEIGTQGLNKFLRERHAMVDRERFDYIDGTMMYLHRLSSSLAMRSVQQQLRLILNDPRARLLPSFRKLVLEHVNEMTQPRTDFHKKASAFSTTYFLGANLSSAMVNLTQSVTTLVPWLISGIDTRFTPKGGVVKGWKDLTKAGVDAVWVTTGDEWKGIAREAFKKSDKTWSVDEAVAANYRRHVESGGINQTVVDDLMYGRDRQMMLNAKFGHGDYGPLPMSKLVTDKVFMASQMMMSPYRIVEHFNAKTAFIAGIRQGHELGLRGDALYNYGTRMQALATFGGGRMNAPGITGARWAREGQLGARSAVGLVNSLQQYGYGLLAMYGQLGKDSIMASRGLTFEQRVQARKAFGTMLMTQTAVAGALGLPFVGASLTLLEKIFGIPANQAVREGLASLGSDDEQGAVIAETALNGFPNQMFGLDLSSRLGTSNILGTSSYRGFSMQDMAGPVSSIVGNAAEALNLFGQGRPMEAAHSLVPAAFKNAIELSDTKKKYGDSGFRDKSGNLLYSPTEGQELGYMFGFRPRELSQKRQMSHLMTVANERTDMIRGQELNKAAQALLQGNPQVAQRMASDLAASDRTFNPQDELRQVMNRALTMQSEKDLLATGSRFNEKERLSLARTFGGDVNTRRSEVELQRLRMELARRLGDPRLAPTLESYKQAALVDQFVTKQGMPRSQAVRLVEFLTSR